MPASMRAWSPRGISRRTSSTGGWSRCPGAAGLGLTAGVWLASGLPPGCGWPRWCGGATACWLDAESCRPRPCCRAWGPLGLLPGRCRPWLCCGGLGSCGVAAGVSINRGQHESLRATCTTLAVGQCPWGTINPPDAPGLVVAGSRWVLSVPSLFLCIGALHPIRRQCTSSVRVQCP